MQSVLVDTSVWSEHFRTSHPVLEALLNDGLVSSHELIIEELALGMSASHRDILDDIAGMGLLPMATLEEYLQFVARNEIAGRRIGCVDTHLLVSCRLADAGLWTLDTHLAAAARDCGIEVIG